MTATTQPRPAAKTRGRRRAAGIYGAIITAAIIDTAGGHLSTAALAVSVVVTLSPGLVMIALKDLVLIHLH